ncbi:MAG: ApaLI family restriction endonuclease [Anaerolineae bacterium]|nr:ApaLI family restriction endonuclease [Anaerolineae bacterium]
MVLGDDRVILVTIEDEIRALAEKYAAALTAKITERLEEMVSDDKSHYLVYGVLGISPAESDAIDLYQNKGRFLYRYAGTFLESAARKCFEFRFPDARSIRLPTPSGVTFEIDCLVGQAAYEIKWRDATTDGDHIKKEQMRVRAIAEAGYQPIRLMFFYPNRKQAIDIQVRLAALYQLLGGNYYAGQAAWLHLQEVTGVDLKAILEKLFGEKST